MDTNGHESDATAELMGLHGVGGATRPTWKRVGRARRSARAAFRFLWLASEIVFALVHWLAFLIANSGHLNLAARSRWLQHVCRRALRVFNVDLRVAGAIPSSGLLVCNHLSYLDILVLGATAPCVFISKCEVRRWPVFGWFALLAGTFFVRRDKRSDVVRITHEMGRALDTGMLVVLFSEGTTSGGHDVLPFKSSLLEPAIGKPHSLSAGFIEYSLSEGSVADEVCYWRDMTLAPHLLNLLGKRGIQARLSFTELRQASPDRKQLARQLHLEVVRLKESFAG